VASTDASCKLFEGQYFIFCYRRFTDTVILAANADNNLKHHRSNAITDTGRLMIKAADNVF
jgi:hypothetical protein